MMTGARARSREPKARASSRSLPDIFRRGIHRGTEPALQCREYERNALEIILGKTAGPRL